MIRYKTLGYYIIIILIEKEHIKIQIKSKKMITASFIHSLKDNLLILHAMIGYKCPHVTQNHQSAIKQ